MTLIRGNIVTPEGVLKGGILRVEDGRIAEAGLPEGGAKVDIDLGDGWAIPGFVDMHCHGGAGGDFMDASAASFETIAEFHGRHGTTSMLATTVTAPKSAIDAVLRATADYIAAGQPRGARLVGVHLEGPFISPKWPGAQNTAYIVPPNADWLKEWTDAYPNLIKQLTLAPETEGALDMIRELSRLGIVAAAGHTDATYEEMLHAADAGLSQAVHTFNAMTPLHHRKPGVVGAVLTEPRIAAEAILDGVHLHPAAVKLLARTKTNGDLILITDAIAAAGLPDGQYSLGELGVTVSGGVARLTEGDSLAGSTLTMIEAFRFAVREIGLTVPEASRLASGNAAAQLGLDREIGSIRAGAAADLVLLTENLDIVQVLRDGRKIGSAAL